MKITLKTVKHCANEAGLYIKKRVSGMCERTQNVGGEIGYAFRSLRDDVKTCKEVGKVCKEGVTDGDVLLQLGPAESGIANYVKANNLNIIFHTPQKPYEVGVSDLEKPLTITVYKEGLLNSYFNARTIDGDVKHISDANLEVPLGDKKFSANVEDTFLRRVYRNITEMTHEVNKQRKKDFDEGIFGFIGSDLVDEIKDSHRQIREGIKEFTQMFNPFKKS